MRPCKPQSREEYNQWKGSLFHLDDAESQYGIAAYLQIVTRLGINNDLKNRVLMNLNIGWKVNSPKVRFHPDWIPGWLSGQGYRIFKNHHPLALAGGLWPPSNTTKVNLLPSSSSAFTVTTGRFWLPLDFGQTVQHQGSKIVRIVFGRGFQTLCTSWFLCPVQTEGLANGCSTMSHLFSHGLSLWVQDSKVLKMKTLIV